MANKIFVLVIVGCVVCAGYGRSLAASNVETERVSGNQGYVHGSQVAPETLEERRNREANLVKVDTAADDEARRIRREARMNRYYQWENAEPQPGYPDRRPPRQPRQSSMTMPAANQPAPQITLPEEKPVEPQPMTMREPLTPSMSQPMTLPQPKHKAAAGSFTEYVVQRGDTLGDISRKVYGTASKWQKIYNFNSDVLKNPNKVYPGQKLKIPQE